MMSVGILAIVPVMALVLLGAPTQAATTITVTNTNDSGPGSLRQAMLDTNASLGLDTIAFDIPAASDPGCNAGTGVCTIRPLSALPFITDPVIIDGYTQPGAIPNSNGPGLGLNTILKIELDGASAGADADGLSIHAGASTVRGLVINRFSRAGIELEGSGGNFIHGNFIGTDVAGFADLGNEQGLFVPSPNNEMSTTGQSPVRSLASSAAAMPPARANPPLVSPYPPPGIGVGRSASLGVEPKALPARAQNVA